MSEMEKLSNQVEIELKALQVRMERVSQVDPHELAADIILAGYNPDYATDKKPKEVVLGSLWLEVHEAGNFPMIFLTVDEFLRTRKSNPDPRSVEANILRGIETAHYDVIFRDLKMQYPSLYRRMREVAQLTLEQRLVVGNKELTETEKQIKRANKEEKAEWDLINSATYNAAASLARSIEPDYNLEMLYISPIRQA